MFVCESAGESCIRFCIGSGNSLSEMFLEDTYSPFANVRNSGWQEIAKTTTDLLVAAALVAARVDSEDCIALATAILRQGATCDITACLPI